MITAKYYIYRNLRTKEAFRGFSIRHKGLVLEHGFCFRAYGVKFKVNEAGRQRVLKEHQKNVHAFVVADKYVHEKYPALSRSQVDKSDRVTYNPYANTHFMCNGKGIYEAEEVVFQNGLCFVVR